MFCVVQDVIADIRFKQFKRLDRGIKYFRVFSSDGWTIYKYCDLKLGIRECCILERE